MRQMNDAVPGIFNQVDGFASHSYPNPGFAQPPDATSKTGIGSFKYEENLIQELTNKVLPVFITETGWDNTVVSDETEANYYQTALQTVWNDPNIIAITPFLLQATGGAFERFSFMGEKGTLTKQYQILQQLPKNQGAPTLDNKVLAAETTRDSQTPIPTQILVKSIEKSQPFSLSKWFHNIVQWFL